MKKVLIKQNALKGRRKHQKKKLVNKNSKELVIRLIKAVQRYNNTVSVRQLLED